MAISHTVESSKSLGFASLQLDVFSVYLCVYSMSACFVECNRPIPYRQSDLQTSQLDSCNRPRVIISSVKLCGVSYSSDKTPLLPLSHLRWRLSWLHVIFSAHVRPKVTHRVEYSHWRSRRSCRMYQRRQAMVLAERPTAQPWQVGSPGRWHFRQLLATTSTMSSVSVAGVDSLFSSDI